MQMSRASMPTPTPKHLRRTAVANFRREALLNRMVPILQMIREDQLIRDELELGDTPSQVLLELAAEFLVGEHGKESAAKILDRLKDLVEEGEFSGRSI
jgi:hypothetical protein